MKNKLDNLTWSGINFLLGVGKGTLDVLTTGLPILSGGLEFWRLGSYLDSKTKDTFFDVSFGKYLSYSRFSLIGSAIPFGIKYHDEICNFVEGVLR